MNRYEAGEGNASYHPLSQQGDSEAQRADPPKVTGQAGYKMGSLHASSRLLEVFLPSWDGLSQWPGSIAQLRPGPLSWNLTPKGCFWTDSPIRSNGSTKVPGQEDTVLMLAPPGSVECTLLTAWNRCDVLLAPARNLLRLGTVYLFLCEPEAARERWGVPNPQGRDVKLRHLQKEDAALKGQENCISAKMFFFFFHFPFVFAN